MRIPSNVSGPMVCDCNFGLQNVKETMCCLKSITFAELARGRIPELLAIWMPFGPPGRGWTWAIAS